MATHSDPEKRRASKEATAWFVLMQEEPDDPDMLARFTAWRSASGLNREAWDTMQRTAGLIARLPPANTGDWRNVPRYQAPRWYRRPAARAATALAVAACVALLLAPTALLRLQADDITGTAETREIALGDGDSARLAPKSAIAIDYAAGQRHVRLLAGEAFFTVRHDPAHPFTVTTGAVRTTDIGTAFDIRRGANDVTVAVREGQVRVEGGTVRAGGVELGAGEILTIGPETARRAAIAPDHIGAWGQGLLAADEEPMGEVVDRLRPWLGARVVMASPQAGRHVTGVYDLTAPEEALRAVARAHGAEIHHLSPWIVVVR
ncbi:FecR family protein [Gluconacetobacter takamatsuzukensis]|nr:FecR domain-containing protein [Gluconacetobacter takamatsuzukensis]